MTREWGRAARRGRIEPTTAPPPPLPRQVEILRQEVAELAARCASLEGYLAKVGLLPEPAEYLERWRSAGAALDRMAEAAEIPREFFQAGRGWVDEASAWRGDVPPPRLLGPELPPDLLARLNDFRPPPVLVEIRRPVTEPTTKGTEE